MKTSIAKIILLFVVTLLSGCAAQMRVNDLANSLNQQGAEHVLVELQKETPADHDLGQFYLNVGYLQLLAGDFPASIKTFEKAKKIMASVEATSVSENMTAGTVNATFRSYSGYPTDRVMVHNMMALSYLFNNDIYGARIEMLQANVAMKKLSKRGSLRGQFASSHLIAAIIYEILDEESNALISYKKAADLLKERDLEVPTALKKALLRMSYQVDRNSTYLTYKKQYPGFPTPEQGSKSQVFTLYFDGVVSNKREIGVMVPSSDGEQLIRIAMPAYPKLRSRINRAKVSEKNHQLTTQLVENLEVSVREDLSAEYPTILAMTTVRAVAKYELVKGANKQSSLAGVLVNIFTAVTEVADLRSWNMLPSNIQFGYLETTENEIIAGSANTEDQHIKLKKGSKNIVLINSVNNKVYHYQQ
jgi:hypothetical protein